MPPLSRPYPRFIADASREGPPDGAWADRLGAAFVAHCETLAVAAGASVDPGTIRWFPERGWGGRVYVPVTARASEPSIPEGSPEGAEPVIVEYFGWVAFAGDAGDEGAELEAGGDFTDVTAEERAGWDVDLSDDVIGGWSSEGDRGGDVTLVWGLPLLSGAVAATAELDGEVLDQCPIRDGRFTLLAVDAIQGFGDPAYLTIHLWDRRLREIARESLYEDGDGDEDEGDV